MAKNGYTTEEAETLFNLLEKLYHIKDINIISKYVKLKGDLAQIREILFNGNDEEFEKENFVAKTVVEGAQGITERDYFLSIVLGKDFPVDDDSEIDPNHG